MDLEPGVDLADQVERALIALPSAKFFLCARAGKDQPSCVIAVLFGVDDGGNAQYAEGRRVIAARLPELEVLDQTHREGIAADWFVDGAPLTLLLAKE